MYDLLLKGGNVIDPSQDLRCALDVAVEDGKIARVAANIPVAEARLPPAIIFFQKQKKQP